MTSSAARRTGTGTSRAGAGRLAGGAAAAGAPDVVADAALPVVLTAA